MDDSLKLSQHLGVKNLENNIFEGTNYSVGSPQIYGGQVLGQALNAAYKTVAKDRRSHSLHAYFLLPGDLNEAVTYQVDEMRDGGSFSARRVLAKQSGKVIFILAASFQKITEGVNYQTQQKLISCPDKLMDTEQIYKQVKDFLPKGLKSFMETPLPFYFKYTDLPNPLVPENKSPLHGVWFKLKGEQPLEQSMRRQMLTYISDYNLLTTALRPFNEKLNFNNTQLATIDHAFWIHRSVDFSDWLLYELELMNASNGRAYVQGKIFDRAGNHIATATQEGVMREKRTKK